MRYNSFGNIVLAPALLLSVAMCLFACIYRTPFVPASDFGLCLSSPNLWHLSPLGSWGVNFLLLLVSAVCIFIFGKSYNIVGSSESLLIASFTVLCASNLWIDAALTSSFFMTIVNLISTYILFGCYRQRSAPQELFIIGTLLSIGSMFQYAFLFMIPVYFLIAATMKCLSFKGFIALGLGVMAPYWIGIGFGWLPLETFHFPQLAYIFQNIGSGTIVFAGLLNCGLSALIGMLFALINFMRLLTENSQRRHYNMALYILGIACILCIIFDFNNIIAYLATLYFVIAVQVTNFFTLRRVAHPKTWLFLMCLVYVALFSLIEFI